MQSRSTGKVAEGLILFPSSGLARPFWAFIILHAIRIYPLQEPSAPSGSLKNPKVWCGVSVPLNAPLLPTAPSHWALNHANSPMFYGSNSRKYNDGAFCCLCFLLVPALLSSLPPFTLSSPTNSHAGGELSMVPLPEGPSWPNRFICAGSKV